MIGAFRAKGRRSLILEHGSYRQVCVNSRTFQGLLKDLPAVFKDYKLMKNVDLHNEILIQEC